MKIWINFFKTTQKRKEEKRREKNERENDKKKGCYIYTGILSFVS